MARPVRPRFLFSSRWTSAARIGLSLGIFCGGFFLAESFLRSRAKTEASSDFALSIYSATGERLSEANGPLKLELAPFTIYKNLPNQKTRSFRIGPLGLRENGLPPARERRHPKKAILIGGSAAFGRGVLDNETIAAQLERANGRYAVLNAGVVAFASGQELAYFVTELVDMHPDLLIAYDGWNDCFDSWVKPATEFRSAAYNPFTFWEFERELIENEASRTRVSAGFYRWMESVAFRSLVLSRLLKAFHRLGRVEIAGGSAGSERLPTDRIDAATLAARYVDSLEKMRDLCRQRGIRFLVVLQPELGSKSIRSAEEDRELLRWKLGRDTYAGEFPELYRRFLAEAKKRLSKESIDFVDVNEAPEFKDNPKTLFLDVVHTNPEGNAVIASLLNKRIE